MGRLAKRTMSGSVCAALLHAVHFMGSLGFAHLHLQVWT